MNEYPVPEPLPKFASGGAVPEAGGPALLPHGGEYVIPEKTLSEGPWSESFLRFLKQPRGQ